MKTLFQLIVFLLISTQSIAQLILQAEGIKPENVCNPNSVYFLMERKARPVESIDSIELKLNKVVTFVSENKRFNAKPSIQCAINCKGELGGGFHMVIESDNEKLDEELLNFFKTIVEWKAGKKNKKKTVDSWYMWRMEIKDGYIDILN